jgi:hypothetical protein
MRLPLLALHLIPFSVSGSGLFNPDKIALGDRAGAVALGVRRVPQRRHTMEAKTLPKTVPMARPMR